MAPAVSGSAWTAPSARTNQTVQPPSWAALSSGQEMSTALSSSASSLWAHLHARRRPTRTRREGSRCGRRCGQRAQYPIRSPDPRRRPRSLGAWSSKDSKPISNMQISELRMLSDSHARRKLMLSGSNHISAAPAGASHRRQRLVEIGDDVGLVLDADREPHHVVAGTGCRALLLAELAVRRRCRMNDEAAHVADVGEM